MADVLDPDVYLDIIENGYESILVRVSAEGDVTIRTLDEAGYIVRGD